MTCDYYEEERKRYEELHIYRNQFGLIIDPNQVDLAYSSGNMDSESTKRFERNNPKFCLVDMIDKQRKENIPKLNRTVDLSGCDFNSIEQPKPSTSGTLLDANDMADLLKKSRLK